MQKKLIALAVASLVSAPVFAQSQVTVGGVIDEAIQVGDWGANNVTRLVSGGNTTNRLFFKGSEDLGNGLKANFHLEHQPNPDAGNTGNANFWHRVATVGLSGSWGKVNFGRQYTPWFSVRAGNDIFHTAGVGSNYSLEAGLTRISNSIRYDSMSMNGFTFSAAYSFGNQAAGVVSDTGQEGTTSATDNIGEEAGLSIKYGNGPLKLAYGYDKQTRTVSPDVDRKLNHLNGSYDFKVAKLVAGWNSMKQNAVTDLRTWYIGGVIPVMGKDHILIEYTRRNNKLVSSADSRLVSLGYEHPMSKRTMLYATYAKMDNDTAAAASLLGGVGVAAGVDPHAFNFGIRHKF